MAADMSTLSAVSIEKLYDLAKHSNDLCPVSFIISTIGYPARLKAWTTVVRTKKIYPFLTSF